MGNVDDLLEFAGNDLSFWRRALSRHVSLIDDAIAQLGIEFDVALISELLADPSFDVATHEEELRLLLKPLDAIETNISPAIHREFLGLALFYRSTMGGDLVFNKYLRLLVLKENSLLRHKLGNSFFLHQQAAINRSSKYFAMAQKLASLPAREFLLERAVFKRKADIFFKENDVNNIFGFTWFYDYAGKWIANAFVTTPSTFESAIARAHNTAAYMLLVRAQLEIRLAGVPAAEVPEFLVGHPESFNPYTKQSFVWDGEQRTLSLVREPDTKILGSSESIQVSVP